jgi:hypothetical protein
VHVGHAGHQLRELLQGDLIHRFVSEPMAKMVSARTSFYPSEPAQ